MTATVATGQSAASAARLAWGAGGAALAVLVPLWGLRRRELGSMLRLALMALAMAVPVVMTGCGGTPRTTPGSGASGGGAIVAATPAGTYAMVVTATSAGLSRSVTLTVTVQ